MIYIVEPLRDHRWNDLVARHPHASVFHQTAWLSALAKTYRYPSLAITTSPPDKPLEDGIVFCEVQSWITGGRAVSLPFSDHVQPLLQDCRETLSLQQWLPVVSRTRDWKYVEIRLVTPDTERRATEPSTKRFALHLLDLSPSVGQLFRNLHRDSVQRRIRHAEREQLAYERGSSVAFLPAFYKLLTRTRARHHVPTQPLAWFENLMAEFGSRAEIRVARTRDTAIAAMLTLRNGKTVVYKYGCSDERFHHFGGVPFLFWKLIEESKSEALDQVDLGRTEFSNTGLLRFKDHLGARRAAINNIRYTLTDNISMLGPVARKAVHFLSAIIPSPISSRVGSRLYRHFG